MNKKGSMMQIFGYSMVFSFISIFYIFLAVLQIGIINDYVIFEMQNVTETLAEENKIGNNTLDYLTGIQDDFGDFNFHIDDLWFLAYMVFIITSLITAYKTRPTNYFGFLSILFYGIMFILFVLSIFTTLSNWFNDEILLNIMPNVIIALPKFYYYLNNVGVFTTIHLTLCLLINLVNLDFANIFARKKQEKKALDEEVV